MGGHYGSIHIRTDDRDEVRMAVENLQHPNTQRYYIAPPINGWVTVFPENNGQDHTVTEALVAKLPNKTMIHCSVHDDDIFAYWFFENGKLSDTYNSCPEYFGDETPPPRGGNVAAFANLLPPQKITRLQKLLDEKRYTFELERQDKFAKLLGLPNTAAAYEYINADDVGELHQRSKFIHVPDLAIERTARRAQKAAEQKELKDLKAKGLLLVDDAAPKTTNKSSYQGLGWAPNPAEPEVIVSWCDLYDDDPSHTTWKRFTSPSWTESTINLPVAASRNGFQLSHSGDRLAICRGSNVHVWDLRKNELAAEHQFIDLVTSVAFGIDDKYLFVTIRGDPKPELHRVALQSGLTNKMITDEIIHFQRVIPHPDGEFIAVIDNFGILIVIEIESMRTIAQRWIPDRPDKATDAQQDLLHEFEEDIVAELSKLMKPDQLATYRKQSQRHSLPKLPVRVACFDTTGDRLFCAVPDGVRGVVWPQIVNSEALSPIVPSISVRSEIRSSETKSGAIFVQRLTYAILFDAARQRILFAGLEGKISYYDLQHNCSGTLLNVPGDYVILDLALGADRSALIATAHRFDFKNINQQHPQHFQIWNYQALCENAEIQF
jgi:hypothetical protein